MMCVVPLCITAIGSIVLFFVAESDLRSSFTHHDERVRQWQSNPTAVP